MKYILQVIQGSNDKGAEFVLKQGRNLLGRSDEADFRLNDMKVSKLQCAIFWNGNGLQLRNLSRYGTRVDAHKLEHNEEIALATNSVIRVGKDTEILLMDADNDMTLTSDDFKDASIVRLSEKNRTRKISEENSNKTGNQAHQADDGMSFLDGLGASVSSGKGDTIPPDNGNATSYGGDTIAPDRGDTIAPDRGDTIASDRDDTIAPDKGDTTSHRGGDTTSLRGGDTTSHRGDNDATTYRGDDTTIVPDNDDTITSNMFEPPHKKGNEAERVEETATSSSEESENTVTIVEGTSAEQTQTSVFDADFEDDDSHQWLHSLAKCKWPIAIIVFLVVVLWSINSGRKLEHLVPENTLDFKYVRVPRSKERKPDVVELSAFREMAGETTRTATGLTDAGKAGDEGSMFTVLCPRSSKMTCRLENDGNRQVIHTFLGKHERVPFHITLSRKRNRDYLCEEFSEAKKRVRKAFEAEGFEFHDAMADMYDFTDFLFTEGGGCQNGLRYWQITYTRKYNALEEELTSGVGENGSPGENVGDLGIPNAVNRTWYGVLRFFRNADVYYCLCTEVPDFVRKQAEQFLTANTLLKFQIDDDEWQDNRFIALSWDGSNTTQMNPGQLAEEFRSFKELFEKQVNPQLFSEQELRLKQFLAMALYNDASDIFDDAFKLFKVLRMERQRNFYNQLRLQWQNAIGTKDEDAAHRRIRNMAELVFNKVEDARYNKVRRNEWNQ